MVGLVITITQISYGLGLLLLVPLRLSPEQARP
jgi:hypothetical protein